MLTPQRLDRLRGYLLEQQAALQQQISTLTDASQESNVGLGNHMAEDATAAFDQAASVSLLRGHVIAQAHVGFLTGIRQCRNLMLQGSLLFEQIAAQPVKSLWCKHTVLAAGAFSAAPVQLF